MPRTKDTPPRYLAIDLPHLSTDRLARARWGRSWLSDGRPEEAPPVVLTALEKSTQRIVAVEAGAGALGLFAGQKLGDARALIPTLDARPAAPEEDARLLSGIAAWCDRYTPLVGLDGTGGLMLDVTGCTHLRGGEAGLMRDLAARLRGQGLSARLSLAGTIGAAWGLARHAPGTVLDPGDTGPLMTLPLSALRLEEEAVAGLKRVGFKTVGCLAGLPRAPVTARFGASVMTRLDQALGRAGESLSPIRPPAAMTAERRFFDPITHETDIARAIALLSEAVVPLLEDRGMGARRLSLRLFRVDGVVETLEVAAANALRAPDRIAALFRERIAGLRREIDAGFGFDLVKLAVEEAQPFSGAQGDLVSRAAPADRFEALADRLGARLGADRVRGFAGADTHIPERSFGTLPVTRRSTGTRATGPLAGAPVPPLTRPLCLLARPEPVETVAEVPDGPPLRFRWRKVPYEVARAEGPERIACEWWRDGRAAPTRDYFRVEAVPGHRFWMFRHGLYARETALPRWYMHGLAA